VTHRPTPMPDSRLLPLLKSLVPLDEEPSPGSSLPQDRTHAAVSVVLRSRADLEILLIRRAQAHGDPWSGHMALPGGRRDPGDRDLFHTAIRETLEETEVDLEMVGATPLGRMEPLIPYTRHLPPLAIVPFVFQVPGDTKASVASPEVDQVFWTPLSRLWTPEASGIVEVPLDGARVKFPCYRVDENVVWGLTYRILNSLEHLF
jgi:8-oxo-dGTP pyrophosphatase MutT (NUDIX family)